MSMEPIIRFLFGATLNILVEQHGVSAVCKAARLHDDSIRRLRRGIGTTGVTHLFFLKEAYPGSFDAMDDLMGGSPAEVVERLGHLTTVEAARDAIDGQLSRLTPKAVAR